MVIATMFFIYFLGSFGTEKKQGFKIPIESPYIKDFQKTPSEFY